MNLEERIVAAVLEGVAVRQRARAAYLAICLGLAPRLADNHPDEWRTAIAALNSDQKLVTYLLSNSPGTAAHEQLEGPGRRCGTGFPQAVNNL